MDYPKKSDEQEARIDYLSGDYQIISPGSYVRCAITGDCIALDELRYWNVERQEVYASARISCKREEKLQNQG